jgi:hypothetical protein
MNRHQDCVEKRLPYFVSCSWIGKKKSCVVQKIEEVSCREEIEAGKMI